MSENEQEIWTGGYSGKDMLGSWMLAAVGVVIGLVCTVLFPGFGWIALALAGMAVLVLLAQMGIRKGSVAYRLTTHWLTCKQGLLSRTTDKIEVLRINDVSVSQSLFQRLMGVGNITVLSSDPSHPEYVMRGVANAVEAGDKIDTTRREQLSRKGVRIDAI